VERVVIKNDTNPAADVSKTSDAANPGCEKMSRRRRPPMDIIRKEPNEENIMRVVVIMRATERERARDSFGN
jgi:hypothetical protein